MPTYENNIPTNDVVFNPAGPSEIPSPFADAPLESSYAQDDPARPLDELILNMQPQRKYLMDILNTCANPASVEDVKAAYDARWEYSPTVYTAWDLCVLLEEAGGLERVTADGAAYDVDAMEPVMVEDDETGAVYYEANEPADLYWRTTAAGQTILDDDDPVARAQGFFDDDANLQPLYKRLLTLCQKGASIAELDDAISFDDLAWEPRVYAAFFIDRMEKADAIEWTGTWKLTEVGTQILALLDGVKDNYSADQQAKNKADYLARTFEADEGEQDEPIEFTGTLIDQAAIKAAHIDDDEAEGANYVTNLGELR